MHITVLTGSPHKKGTSALLADRFIAGAQENGHDIVRFDTAFMQISPCRACNFCRETKQQGDCAQHDDMERIGERMVDTDLVVLVTPLYFFDMSAQLKMTCDRLYAFDRRLHQRERQSILLATSEDAADWTMSSLIKHYEIVCRYMKWQDRGMVLATGCLTRAKIETTDFPEQAYQLGRSLTAL